MLKKEELTDIILDNKQIGNFLDLSNRTKLQKEFFRKDGKKNIYWKIKKLKEKYKITLSAFCKLFHVSRSGYYKWLKNSQPSFHKWNEGLAASIKEIYFKYNRVYGYNMISMLLKRMRKIEVKPLVVYRYTKKLGYLSIVRKKKHNYNLVSGEYRYDNIYNRDFKSEEFGRKLVTDITYLLNNSNTLYLSVVKDLYNNEIIDYKISDNLGTEFVYQNIKDVKVKIGLKMKSFIHSDQGMHYTIKNYKDLCNELNLTISMSRRGVSPDNGACESFFASLKTEAIYIKNRKKWKKDELNIEW